MASGWGEGGASSEAADHLAESCLMGCLAAWVQGIHTCDCWGGKTRAEQLPPTSTRTSFHGRPILAPCAAKCTAGPLASLAGLCPRTRKLHRYVACADDGDGAASWHIVQHQGLVGRDAQLLHML